MAGFWQSFGFKSGGSAEELPNLFPLSIKHSDFVELDVQNIYSKILTDVLERTEGIPAEVEQALWDNCLMGESADGLVTLLAKAMTGKTDLAIIWDSATKVIRLATHAEKVEIEAAVKAGKDSKGVLISFKNYKRTDMVKIYSGLEYCAIGSLNKTMNLANAIQFKMKDLRGGVSLSDSGSVIDQAKAVAAALKNGNAVLVDEKDIIETAKIDMAPTEKSLEVINQRRAFYLGMPGSYISGIQSKGMSDTGKADTKAVERGLKNYFFSVIKPVVEAVFGTKVTFKTSDFEMLDSALNALKSFDLTSDDYLSAQSKAEIISVLFAKKTEKPPKQQATPAAGADNGTGPKPGQQTANPANAK